ncbi:MAG: cobalt transporter CbiM [Desulfobulbaceae bacterium]|jgi:cobalt/nickel transport system permease protein|nr:cobalt transporter CbiM [Desulfobulbaceae bacterium]
MHISDGVLPISVSVAAYVAAGAGVAVSLRFLRPEDLPKIAVVTSAFFVASLISVPMGPTSVHLLLPGIVGILLGPAAFLSIAVGLILQCFLFQFGGITALGVNALMMGVPALVCAGLFRWLQNGDRRRAMCSGALVGGLGTALAACFLALFLATAGENFFAAAKLALVAHAPVVILEAVVTAAMTGFLFRVKPELLCLPPRSKWRGKGDCSL